MVSIMKSVELPNGVKLPYVEEGDPSGVPVLLLHGITDSWRSFEPVLPYLPDSIHTFALTQRGHGDADRPESGYRTRDFAVDVAGFVDALGLGPVVVAGHSMGSTNAKRFAIDYPERVLGLVLIGAFCTYRGNPPMVDLWQTDVSQLTDPIDPGFVREFQESTVARPMSPAFLETVVQESLKAPARVWRAALEGLLEDDFADEVDQIKARTLLIWGGQDTLCSRRDQDVLLSAIAQAKLVVYEDAGHAAHWEEPERLAADLEAFVRSLGN
jgi:non-heme chloroperoxidase